MADFRIVNLDDYNKVLNHKSYIADDRGAFTETKKFDITQLSNLQLFYYVYYNYLNDFIYYDSKSKAFFGKLFTISNNNTNINFTQTTVGKSTKYTPSTNAYNFESYSQLNYDDYFTIDKDVYNFDVTYYIDDSFYSKIELDRFFERTNFDIKENSNILEVTTSNSDPNFKSAFYIVNSALYTDSSTHNFNPFFKELTNSNGVYGKNVFLLNEDASKNGYYMDNGLVITDDAGTMAAMANNYFDIHKEGKFMNMFKNVLNISNNYGGYFISNGNTLTILDNVGYNSELESLGYSLIIGEDLDFSKLDAHNYQFVLGKWDKKTLNFNEGKFEFNGSDYGLVIDGTEAKVKVGNIVNKNIDIYFGNPLNVNFRTTYKFYIGYYENGQVNLLNVNDYGVYYKGVDLLRNGEDMYETSSYWDLVINKDKLERDVLYTY